MVSSDGWLSVISGAMMLMMLDSLCAVDRSSNTPNCNKKIGRTWRNIVGPEVPPKHDILLLLLSFKTILSFRPGIGQNTGSGHIRTCIECIGTTDILYLLCNLSVVYYIHMCCIYIKLYYDISNNRSFLHQCNRSIFPQIHSNGLVCFFAESTSKRDERIDRTQNHEPHGHQSSCGPVWIPDSCGRSVKRMQWNEIEQECCIILYDESKMSEKSQ